MNEIIHPWFRDNRWIWFLVLILGLVLANAGGSFSYIGFAIIVISLIGMRKRGKQESV